MEKKAETVASETRARPWWWKINPRPVRPFGNKSGSSVSDRGSAVQKVSQVSTQRSEVISIGFWTPLKSKYFVNINKRIFFSTYLNITTIFTMLSMINEKRSTKTIINVLYYFPCFNLPCCDNNKCPLGNKDIYVMFVFWKTLFNSIKYTAGVSNKQIASRMWAARCSSAAPNISKTY